MSDLVQLQAKDYKSNQEVRWCPGCGDIAVLSAAQKALADLGIPKEKAVFVSGIGCSSRFPYYMGTYGFHGIHGRAAAIATGLKVARPDLSVWQITGDGDAMAIGGNHFIHEIRRNIDINVILFNNRIYGLTKGQFSPTSHLGLVTKSSPYGTVERPFRVGELTIGAQGTFFARTIDSNIKMSTEVFIAAQQHRGTSVVEVLQNCVIFNDGVHEEITAKETKEDNQILLEQGKPMLFANGTKGLIVDGLKLKAVTIGENGITLDKILVHNAEDIDPTLHLALSNMELSMGLPVAFGVIRAAKTQTYDAATNAQIESVKATAKIKNLQQLLLSGNTWKIE